MQLTHTFEVPADIATAWAALSDLGTVASCMPGATLTDIDGDHFEGRVKVKVGPMQLTYRGEGLVVDLDQHEHRIAIEASGKEARGQGTARAAVRAELQEAGDDATGVAIFTDLDVTGKPAQFGRGVMNDVGQKLLDNFADRLAEQLEGATQPPPVSAASEPGSPVAAASSGSLSPSPSNPPPPPPPPGGVTARSAQAAGASSSGGSDEDEEVIDLMDVAGGAIAKRLAPIVGVGVIALIVWLLRRRRD